MYEDQINDLKSVKPVGGEKNFKKIKSRGETK